MAKIVLTDLANLQNETTAVNAINDNNAILETAMTNTLSRDGQSPNQMQAILDMNSHQILNLPAPTSDTEPVRLVDLTEGIVGPTGPQGRPAGFSYGWKTDTTATDPLSGFVKGNNAALVNITSLYISEVSNDGNIAAYLATLDDSTSPIKATITLSSATNSSVFAIYNVTGNITDNGTWDTVPVTYVSSSGSFTNLLGLTLQISLVGNKGADGVGDMLKSQNLSGLSNNDTARSNILIPDLVSPGFPMYNGTVVESRAANAATYAIKTLSGADPSASNPVRIGFKQTTGSYVERAITAATSITIPAGATLGATNTVRFQLAIVAIDNAGTVVLGVANRMSATAAAGSTPAGAFYLDQNTPITTTAITAGSATAGVIYTTALQISKMALTIARAEYDTGLVTAGQWASAPTRILLERPGSQQTSLPVSFFAHKNNIVQTGLPHQLYALATFPFARFNVGGFYNTATSAWTPPAGLIQITGNIWWQANIQAAPANCVVKLWKNGQLIEIAAGEGWSPAGFPNTGGAVVASAVDLANGTDTYQLYAYQETLGGGSTGVIDGNPAHTWFCGRML